MTGLGQQAAGLGVTGTSGMSAEYIASMGTGGGADLGSIVMVGVQRGVRNHVAGMSTLQRANLGARMGGADGMKKFQQGLSIISITLTIVEMMELTIGFGAPTEGDDLKVGAQQFTALSEQLKSARPDYHWEGSGSDAYAELDKALETMAQTMAGLDVKLAALVSDQAEWVTHARLGFGILKDILLAALIIELVMTFAVPAPTGPVAAKAFAITVATLGIGAATAFLGGLTYLSVTNGKQAELLASQYAQLAAGTVQTGSDAKAGKATSGETAVSSFTAISDSMSGMSALSATPTLTSSTGAANGSEDERAPLAAQVSASESAGDGAVQAQAQDEAAPDKDTPPAPTGTMPNVAQLSATSGQAAKLSGQLSQPAQLVNQAMGQVQQMVQMAQQGQGAAAPAEEAATDAALAGEVEGAGSGAAGAERAPVEAVMAGAEPMQQPSPVERVV
ncbi:EspA/EspE family type VII secretion system effector [Mycobacterium sp. E342]|uniref:EspA/EspE family type VII secretion system effector n=1 Tax=Mycobacterium sp. E342 TaxID=1834147 RepID=UPI0012EA65F7|nr:EspA/EspE family type VII secretion system effector [Mycobacterium sp. E342]